MIDKKIKLVKRKKQYRGLDALKSVGIVWNGKDQDIHERLVNLLDEKQIKHTDLCFSETLPIEGIVNIVNKKDFNFWGMPKNKNIEHFINTEFDLLIDMSLSTSLGAQVIRSLSRASLKAGWSAAVPDYFDLSIDVSKNPDPRFLVKQLVHYLNAIN